MSVVKCFRLLPFIASVFFDVVAAGSLSAPNYTFLHEATTAPANATYDYIVIGGGATGCPLAATLSQNASVLLLERGGSPYGNPNITDLSALGVTYANASPTSPSQPFVSTDGVQSTRARVLGGGTSINLGFYSRGEFDIFVNQRGFNMELMNESYAWVERKIVFEQPLKQWQTAFRDGMLEADILPDNGVTYDHLYGTKVSGSIFDEQGHRHTAADLLEYANPDSITVLLHANVHRILFAQHGEERRIKAIGVEFKDASGKMHTAYLKEGAENEVVASAGTLGSPQLLMLSGLGPASQLQARNITMVMDNPMVGQYMADNPLNIFVIPSSVTVEMASAQAVGITRSGIYIEGGSGLALFSAGVQAPGSGFIVSKVSRIKSTGHMEIQTASPDDTPSVTFNYFSAREDLEKCVEGIKTVASVIESKAFSKFDDNNMSIEMLMSYNNGNVSAPSIEQYCKDKVTTMWHYHGGCLVGKVVDNDYKVLGVDALRVIDLSTFDYTPGTNPAATLMMLGRYMGVKIQRERVTGLA